MHEIKVGDTVRIKNDDASMADVRAGQCGYVTHVAHDDEGNVEGFTARVCGTLWQFVPEDVEVLDTVEAFKAVTAEMKDLAAELAAVVDLYDAPAPLDGIPVEEVPSPQAVTVNAAGLVTSFGPDDAYAAEDDDHDHDEDEDESDCPEGPHYHDENGEPHSLPHVEVEDKDGDFITVTDVRALTEEQGIDIAAFIRILTPQMGGRMLEVHLTAQQAMALAAFIAARFGTPRN